MKKLITIILALILTLYSEISHGADEPRLKMVMNGAEFEEIDCSIISEFLTTLPRTAVHVPNPTFKVSVIGRRMLTYCSTFGAEE